jgi:hypothetical protein
MNETSQFLIKQYNMTNVPYPTRTKSILKQLDANKSYIGYVGNNNSLLLVQGDTIIFQCN